LGQFTRRNQQEASSSKGKSVCSSEYFNLISVFKAIFDELCKMVEVQGREPFVPQKGRCNVFMFVGLQGSGKTTSCTKLAHYYARKGWRVGLVCGDTFRAGAFDQLKQNAAKAKIPFYGAYDEADPVKIVSEGCAKFKAERFEIIIVDTSGRHKQEGELFREMQLISGAANPDSVIFVMDASIGQAAEAQARAFKDAVPVGSIILTKMDGSGKGGGALSAVAATGAPIAFIGTGEHMYDFEAFQAQSFVGKLLGMGDVSGLMERVNEMAHMTSKEKTMEMAKRLEQGIFTLGDLKEQLQMMVNMGPMSKMLAMIPGMGGLMQGAAGGKDEDISGKMKSFVTCLDSLSRSELAGDGKILSDPSRLRRITRGSGCREEVVQELLQHHRKFAQMIKKMGGGNGGFMKNMMGAMGGAMGGGGRNPASAAQMMQQMQNGGGLDFSQLLGAGGMGGGLDPTANASSIKKRPGKRN